MRSIVFVGMLAVMSPAQAATHPNCLIAVAQRSLERYPPGVLPPEEVRRIVREREICDALEKAKVVDDPNFRPAHTDPECKVCEVKRKH